MLAAALFPAVPLAASECETVADAGSAGVGRRRKTARTRTGRAWCRD